MNFEITGTLIEKFSIVNVSEKFRKREFVISKTDKSGNFEFTEYIKFQLTQDRCSLVEPYLIGDEIRVAFNLRGRKWEKDGTISYFTNLEAWKIDKNQVKSEYDSPGSLTDEEIPMPTKDDAVDFSDDEDILPF